MICLADHLEYNHFFDHKNIFCKNRTRAQSDLPECSLKNNKFFDHNKIYFAITGPEFEVICPATFLTVKPTVLVLSIGTTDSSEMLQGKLGRFGKTTNFA